MHCARMFINTNKFGAAGQGRGRDQCWYIALSLLRPQTQRARAHTHTDTRPKVHSGGGRRINRVRVPQNKVSAGELMARENCINFNSTATCLNSKWAHFLRWKEQKRHKSTAPWWKMKSTRDAFLALSIIFRAGNLFGRQDHQQVLQVKFMWQAGNASFGFIAD